LLQQLSADFNMQQDAPPHLGELGQKYVALLLIVHAEQHPRDVHQLFAYVILFEIP
jgi:hypothetical protein